MCGICGVINKDKQNIETVKYMCNSMIHRGPDEYGYYEDEGFSMGMRRLSIIDLEGGHQPIYSNNKQFVIVFNGEIYNFIELREGLIKKGYHFLTKSDTEVIVNLFQEYGKEGIKKLNGMFSISIWDIKNKVLHLFRDRFGVKPLFYYQDDEKILYSSDLKGLSNSIGKKKIDKESFLQYLMFSYVPYPNTIFENIKKVPPATYLMITNLKEISIEKLWNVDDIKEDKKDFNIVKSELLSKLEESVSIQKRGDVPIGVFLSGGIDSSSLVVMLDKQGIKDINTFSMGFENGLDETYLSELVAKKYNTNHRKFIMNDKEAKENLIELIQYLDEPLSDNSLIPTYFLSKKAKENGVKVVLNGAGGDELFGGYFRYLSSNKEKILRKLPSFIRKSISLIYKNDEVYKKLIESNELMFLYALSGVNFTLLKNMLNKKEYKDLIAETTNFINTRISSYSGNDLMKFDFTHYLVDDIFSLFDKMSMGASIEGRVPFIDNHLVDFAYSIPSEYKIDKNKNITKIILKESMKNLLPNELFNAPKMGFSGPTKYWVNYLKDDIKILFQNHEGFLKENFNMNYLEDILKKEEIPQKEVETIFAIYIFLLWYKENME